MPRCARQILEPMMKLGVFTPEEKVGDLNRRRSIIQGQSQSGSPLRRQVKKSDRSV